MDSAIDHAIDPALAVLSLRELEIAAFDYLQADAVLSRPSTAAAAHWTSFEEDRLRVAAQAIDASSATAWVQVAEQIGTGKDTSQCEARWNELRMGEARSAPAEDDQERTTDDHQIASGMSQSFLVVLCRITDRCRRVGRGRLFHSKLTPGSRSKALPIV